MKKAFDQTVRELKREVNKKVLKVPGIEQKILDATSNESWGPHGSLLADIAQATRNYHECQIVMHVIWKRLNDTGKNWRHVYKALIVLEYLVGQGSERVTDEIREHAYQISTLSDFQYIDSSGKDQGNNVRRKSQALVSLVNDKEKIQEVRQKAAANKDKYRPSYSSSGSNKPGSYSGASGYGDRYDDDHYDGRYGGRDDDRNGYGRGKDLGYRDDDRYGRGGDFNRYGDGSGRDSDEHSGRGSYKNDDIRGSRGDDDYQFASRNKSFDKNKDHSYEDDGYSYRNGGDRANDASPDARNIEPKLSEQSAGAPPTYDSVVRSENNIVRDEKDEGVGTAAVPKVLSPAAPMTSPSQSNHHGEPHAVTGVNSSPLSMDDTSDEFDPRGFTPAVNSAPPAASSASPVASGLGVDLFGNSSTLDPVNSLALVLSSPITTNETEATTTNSGFERNFVALSSASAALSHPTEDPFGDGPFKASSQDNFPNQGQTSVSLPSFAPFPSSANSMPSAEPIAPVAPIVEPSLDFGFGDSLSGLTYIPVDPMYATNPAYITSELPPTQPNFDVMSTHLGPSNLQTTITDYGHASFPMTGISTAGSPAAQPFGSVNLQTDEKGFLMQQFGPSIPQAAPLPIQSVQPTIQQNIQAAPQNLAQQPGLAFPQTQRASATVSGSSSAKQPSDTFETKSSVWADTLNRGLVNLNISGSKTNPLADIGVDFDSINRLERRKEKEKGSVNTIASTVTMGRAMRAGSGIGQAGAGTMNPMTRPAMGMGMGMGGGGIGMGGPGGIGIGMGAYGGAMNQPMGMGIGQASSMRPRPEMQSPSPAFPGSGYNSMMGMGGYGSNQPYGGGYR